MAAYTRLQFYHILSETGLMPLFYHPDPETAFQITAACYRGGARTIEFTNRGDFAHEVFGDLQKRVQKELPGMVLGAGSIPDAGTASLYMQLGAGFIVSPVLSEEVAKTCNRRKIAYLPGCSTLTEIAKAEEMGCEVVKLFPGEMFGPSFVKGLKGPMRWTSVMVTGGVEPTEASIREWFDAGVFCVGIGSRLISSELMDQKQFDHLEKTVANVISWIKQVRSCI
ncbi:MAG: bifunctional 4-hydroxy-2-oxoglutarate aldolase/2-dehydro-3-deoxy-phosphogluconate aldolase [Saprospiraceae bacterium]|nr:bifunctional 4-hydroxy-2-oxoglutarate aldolase/2-dehydro-3-deoxy-phosphogluconate aldolase [Saprospiraceae bacterium]